LKLAQTFLTLLDEELAQKRGPQWKVVGKRKREDEPYPNPEDGHLLISHDLQGALNRLQRMQKKAFQEKKKEIEGKSCSRRVKERLRKEVRKSGKDIGTCLPALYGPHSGRPWVQVLREIASLKIDPNLN